MSQESKIPIPEIFTAHELFDPFGIRRHGEMKVVFLTDHELHIAKLAASLEREIERLKADVERLQGYERRYRLENSDLRMELLLKKDEEKWRQDNVEKLQQIKDEAK